MEVDEQVELGRIAKHIAILLYPILLVAVPEIDLDALDAPLPQSGELRSPCLLGRHAVARRLGDDVVRAAGVVPEEQADTLGPGAIRGIVVTGSVGALAAR